MKKVLSIICAVVMLIAPYNVYAQEVSGYGSADATVTYHVDSEWCVLIPETLTADGTSYQFSASYMNLCDGDSVVVTVSGLNDDSTITLTNSSGGTTTAQIYAPSMYDGAVPNLGTVGYFGNGQLTSEQTFSIQAAEGTSPGDYSGTITFNIGLMGM